MPGVRITRPKRPGFTESGTLNLIAVAACSVISHLEIALVVRQEDLRDIVLVEVLARDADNSPTFAASAPPSSCGESWSAPAASMERKRERRPLPL